MEVCVETGHSCNRNISVLRLKSGVIVIKKSHTVKKK